MERLRTTILAIAITVLAGGFTGGAMMGCGGSQKPAEPAPAGEGADPAGPDDASGDAADPAGEEAMPDQGESLRGTDPCGGDPCGGW